MENDPSISVSAAVHKLQLFLLDGIQTEDQLFAAGSLMSRRDYNDVVVERSIANLCGYPICKNMLPSERLHKGRYRISLKEHRVYDLHETSMYCSDSCLVNSRAFGGSLYDERCSVINPSKITGILNLFLDSQEDSDLLMNVGYLGMSQLKIQERSGNVRGEVSLEDWVGPSNAIEGYVPQKNLSQRQSAILETEGKKPSEVVEDNFFFKEMDFTSTIITSNEYSIAKSPTPCTQTASAMSNGARCGSASGEHSTRTSLSPTKGHTDRRSTMMRKETAAAILNGDKCVDSQPPSFNPGMKHSCDEKIARSVGKSSLKRPGSKKDRRSVSWADKGNSKTRERLCEIKNFDAFAASISKKADNALCDASTMISVDPLEVIAAEKPSDTAEGNISLYEMPDKENCTNNESRNSVLSPSKAFDPENSWYDFPPEGFCMTLSPFAVMWDALFQWVTSSSVAFVYGKEEEEMVVNGRHYPTKHELNDGRSSEIKLAVAGFLSRSIPGLVTDLKLSVPTSTMEKAVDQLLNTMSFVEALPALRMKQWHVIALLFLEALSVCKVPSLSLPLDRRLAVQRVLNGTKIELDEYEVLKDLLLPLGHRAYSA